MRIEWLVTYLTPVGSPDRAERATYFGGGFCGAFFANSGRICGQGATLLCRNPLLSPKNFTQGHLMKTEWLVANETALQSPDRSEHGILGVILAGRFFGQFRPYLWSANNFAM